MVKGWDEKKVCTSKTSSSIISWGLEVDKEPVHVRHVVRLGGRGTFEGQHVYFTHASC